MEQTNNSFKELLEVLNKCKASCPWTKEQSVESYGKELLSEAQEIKEALEKQDYQNLKEELGDLMWDLLMVSHLAQDAGHFKVEEVFQNVIEKMKRRKPYIFEGKKITTDEAARIWQEVKKQEKEQQ
jgi:tetrapyrrole methylase family protein / MazG family protein